MEIDNYTNTDHVSAHRTTLLRGYSLQDSNELLYPALSCRRRSIDKMITSRPVPSSTSRESIPNATSDQLDEETLDIIDEMEVEQPPTTEQYQSRRATISSGTLARDTCKRRPSNLRDWPFGRPEIRSDGDYFEIDLNINGFQPEEISVKIMGKDLIIHCKPNPNLHLNKENIPKELFRCYPLPLSTVPSPSDVSILKNDEWLRIAIRKEAPIKSPIGLLFAPEISQILEEESGIDVVEAENKTHDVDEVME